MAAIDEMFTMQPEPRSAMARPNTSVGTTVPCRFSRMTSSNAPIGTSKILRLSLRAAGTLPPAALIRMSTRPHARTTSSQPPLTGGFVNDVGDDRHRRRRRALESRRPFLAASRPPADDGDLRAGGGQTRRQDTAEHAVAAGHDGDTA